MRALPFLASIAVLTACGSGEQPANVAGNDTARITNQIAQQAQEIDRQANNGAAEIEQALENEGAATFENRDALLNETANSSAGTVGNKQ